jgi:DNA mismatch endonuclease (patch repair protein)
MADVHTEVIRSYNMSRIRSKDTKPELLVRKALFANGFRYRLHKRELPGRPDVVLKKYKTVIFVHGCFWHGHEGCKYFVVPGTRTEWWLKKINRNKQLDEINSTKLQALGWRVIEIYECRLKKGKREKTISDLISKLKTFI